MQPSVYVIEPQTLFVPELMHAVTGAGGRVVRFAESLDVTEVASLRVDYALLDLDYSLYSVDDGLAIFGHVAPGIRTMVLTDECDAERVRAMRRAGAWAVLPKTLSDDELLVELWEIFEADAMRLRPTGTAAH
ncbi:MAG TPA: hypothetical protein VHT53_01490 [Candidatus Elarobacter sp.]|nr:hypothetical protein [Candidatus Elarobacter sp.]